MLLLYIVSFKEFGSLVCLWHDVKLRKTQLEVRSLTATWSRDLWGHRVVVCFLEMCQIVGWTAMANLAALRAAVFSLSAKNLTGGWNQPPAGARVNRGSALNKSKTVKFFWLFLIFHSYPGVCFDKYARQVSHSLPFFMKNAHWIIMAAKKWNEAPQCEIRSRMKVTVEKSGLKINLFRLKWLN